MWSQLPAWMRLRACIESQLDFGGTMENDILYSARSPRPADMKGVATAWQPMST